MKPLDLNILEEIAQDGKKLLGLVALLGVEVFEESLHSSWVKGTLKEIEREETLGPPKELKGTSLLWKKICTHLFLTSLEKMVENEKDENYRNRFLEILKKMREALIVGKRESLKEWSRAYQKATLDNNAEWELYEQLKAKFREMLQQAYLEHQASLRQLLDENFRFLGRDISTLEKLQQEGVQIQQKFKDRTNALEKNLKHLQSLQDDVKENDKISEDSKEFFKDTYQTAYEALSSMHAKSTEAQGFLDSILSQIGIELNEKKSKRDELKKFKTKAEQAMDLGKSDLEKVKGDHKKFLKCLQKHEDKLESLKDKFRGMKIQANDKMKRDHYENIREKIVSMFKESQAIHEKSDAYLKALEDIYRDARGDISQEDKDKVKDILAQLNDLKGAYVQQLDELKGLEKESKNPSSGKPLLNSYERHGKKSPEPFFKKTGAKDNKESPGKESPPPEDKPPSKPKPQ